MQGNYKAVSNCERPKCSACEFGKGHRLTNKINTINNNPMKEQELKKDHLMTGQMVSAYHYISRDLGRLYHTKANQINMRCSQEDVSLLTMPVVM